MALQIVRLLYYILFFFTPLLINHKTSELFEFNKMMFIYAITICILFFWFIDKLKRPLFVFHKSWVFVPFLLFLTSQVVSTVFSIDVHTSLFGYYGRFNGGLLSILSYLSLFAIFIDIFTVSFMLRLLKVSLISSVVVMLWGMPGKFGYDLTCYLLTGELGNGCWTNQFRPAERLFSTIGQPNWLGAYVSVSFFVGLFFLFFEKKRESVRAHAQHIALLVSVLLAYVVLLFTRSDSAILATGAGFAVFAAGYALIHRKRLRTHLKPTVIPLVIGLLLLTIVCKTGIPQIDRYLTLQPSNTATQQDGNSQTRKLANSPTSVAVVTDSVDIRKIVWKGAWELGQKYPLFGTGVETYAYAYYFTRPMEHNSTSEWDFIYNKAHNEFLNYLATTGFIGAGSYILMLLTGFALIVLLFRKMPKAIQETELESVRNYHLLLLSFLSILVSIVITNAAGFSVTVMNLYLYILLAMVVSLFIYKRIQAVHSVPEYQPVEGIKKNILHALVTLFFAAGLTYCATYYVADLVYASADASYRSGDYQEASNLFNQSLNLHYEHVYEDKLSYSLANLSYYAFFQKDEETAKRLISLADYYNLKSLRSSPMNVFYWRTRAKNYYLFYQSSLDIAHVEKGLEALRTAQKYAPTDPKLPYSLALYYSLIEDDKKDVKEKQEYQKKSLEAVESSIRMKPNFEDGYFLKAQLLTKYGNKMEAKDTLEYLLQYVNPAHEEAKEQLKTL